MFGLFSYTISATCVMSFYFSAHRVTSFRDLMHEDDDDSGEEEGQRY